MVGRSAGWKWPPEAEQGSWLEGGQGLPLIENGQAFIQVVAQLDPDFGVALPLGSRRDLQAVFVEGDLLSSVTVRVYLKQNKSAGR